MSYFDIETNISPKAAGKPILFAHKRSISRPEGYFMHLNDHVELYVFIDGAADYVVEGQCMPLSRGDVIVILPHEIHVPVLHRECDYERFYMLIPTDALAHLGLDTVEEYRGRGHKISLPPREREEFLRLLYRISGLGAREDTRDCQLEKLGLFLQVQGLLLSTEHSEVKEPDVALSADFPRLLRDVLRHITLYAAELRSVGEIAAAFYITPEYLSALFKRHVGVNISDYLRMKKIALAKECLERGRSVTEVSYACGFSDTSYFIRIFRRTVGMTPKQYQNAVLSLRPKE